MTEYEAIEIELAEVTLAISHILKGGQEYTITSATGFGTQRSFTAADLKTLYTRKKELQADLNSLNGLSVATVRAGW